MWWDSSDWRMPYSAISSHWQTGSSERRSRSTIRIRSGSPSALARVARRSAGSAGSSPAEGAQHSAAVGPGMTGSAVITRSVVANDAHPTASGRSYQETLLRVHEGLYPVAGNLIHTSMRARRRARHHSPREVLMARGDGGNTGGIGLGGILVIVGIVLMIIWSFWIGLIIALVGLIAFGGFARGKWY